MKKYIINKEDKNKINNKIISYQQNSMNKKYYTNIIHSSKNKINTINHEIIAIFPIK